MMGMDIRSISNLWGTLEPNLLPLLQNMCCARSVGVGDREALLSREFTVQECIAFDCEKTYTLEVYGPI